MSTNNLARTRRYFQGGTDNHDLYVPSQAELAVSSAELSALRDHLKAALASQALDNTAYLAEKVERYIREAPEGREAYLRILHGYSITAILELMGGDP